MPTRGTAFGLGLVLVLSGLQAAADDDAADRALQLPPELKAANPNRHGDDARPGSLQGQLHRNGRQIAVDCDPDGLGVVQAAIEESDPGDSLLVEGTCAENLFFPDRKDRLTLDRKGTATG